MAASFSIKLLFLICALASKISLLSFSLQKSNIHQTSSPLRRFSYFHSSQTKEIKCEISILYDGKSEGDVVSPPRSFYDTTTTPTITALIGCTAFLFQIFGIFPWHEKLQTAYESVAVVNAEVEKEDDRIEAKLQKLKLLQAEIIKKMH